MVCTLTEYNDEVKEPQDQQKQQTNGQDQSNSGESMFGTVVQLAEMACNAYLDHKEQEAKHEAEENEHWRKYREQETSHQRWTLVIVTIIFGIIVGFVSVLVYYDKVSSEALMFIVGTIVSYLIVIIQKLTNTTTSKTSK